MRTRPVLFLLVGVICAATIIYFYGNSTHSKPSASSDEASDHFSTAVATPEEVKGLIKAAQKEGVVESIGMPDYWANWKDTWHDITTDYHIQHQDTDLSSARQLAKFKSEQADATADIGDVGFGFGPIAAKMGILQPYKPTTWNDIPDWAKDKDGYWALAYTGTIAFIINKNLVKNPPHSWHDLLHGHYRVTLGDVGIAAQANSGLLAAAYAMGGGESNVNPALDLFATLAKQGRLSLNDPDLASLEKGEVEVGIVWDFNGLSFAHKIDPKRFLVVVPSDGSLTSGYTPIINRFAKHPNAAKLTKEFIFSDQGQINLAKGFARPIRPNVKLPAAIKANLLPDSEYKSAHILQNSAAWDRTSSALPALWQQHVLIYMQ